MLQNPLIKTSEHPEIWRPLFVRLLRSVGDIRMTAESVGVTTQMVRNAMRKDSSFALLVGDALEDHTSILEVEAVRRAMNGSDLLLMFMLKARNPEKYREKTTINGGTTLNVKAYVGFSPDDWDRSAVVDSTAVALDDRPEDNSPDLSLPTRQIAPGQTVVPELVEGKTESCGSCHSPRHRRCRHRDSAGHPCRGRRVWRARPC